MHPAGDAGVIDHDVEAAELLHRKRHQLADLAGIRGVGVLEERPGTKSVGEGTAPVAVDVADDHPGAF